MNRVVICGLLLLLWPGSIHAQLEDQESLPKLDQLEVPGIGPLLNEPPRDWIVLKSGGVLIVESVSPRPNTLTRLAEQLAAKEDERRKAPMSERERLDKEIQDLRHLFVILPDVPGNPEFKLPILQVDRLIHHEDLMIWRINLLLDEKNVDQALELFFRLRENWNDWKGMTEAYQRILFVDGVNRLDRGAAESALVVFDELYRNKRDYPELSEKVGQAVQQLIEQALTKDDYLRAQFFLNLVSRMYSDHPVYRQFSGELTTRAAKVMESAAQAAAQGDARLAAMKADEAVRIWPRANELKNPHRAYTERFQRLKVGVLDVPGEAPAYPVPSAAEERHRRLTELPLFEINRNRDGNTYYRTRFFDEWEPLDLGRQMRFTLRQYRQPYELQPLVATPDVVTPILEAITPGTADFDERLAAYIESVVVESPAQFSLIFRRVPARLEPLLARVSLTQDRPDDVRTLAPLTPPGAFRLVEEAGGSRSYLRNLPEPDGLPKFHVAEVVEVKYDSAEKAVQGLLRGEVSMLPDLPDWVIRRMQSDEEFLKKFNLVPYGMPTTHVLQFNPASVPLRVKELRSALAYAVDQQRLLREIVLRDPKAAHGRIVTTPFLSDNPARNVLIQPRRYDLSSALAMTLSAQRRLKEGIPKLTMLVAPGREAEDAAREMARVWGKIGIQVQLVLSHEPAPKTWDILYRTLQMSEPLVDMWPFLTFQERARLSDLDIYPDWLKQELVDMDRISDQGRAVAAMQVLHRHLWENTAFVSLWEVDRFLVLRKNIQGYPRRMIHCYDDIDRWTIDAFFQSELP